MKAYIDYKKSPLRKSKSNVVYISSYKKRNIVKAYTKTDDDWYDIPRADDSDKKISFKASRLIGKLMLELHKKNGTALYRDNHWFSKITDVRSSKQNKRIRDQINHIFNFDFHKIIIVDGVLFKDVYEIHLTEEAYKKLSFEDVKKEKQNNSQKRPKAASNKALDADKNVPTCGQKCPPYIDDKEKEEEALAYSSSFSNNEKIIIKSLSDSKKDSSKPKKTDNTLTTQPEEIAIGAISHSAKTETVSREVKLMKPDKISSIGKLNTEIFKAFDNKTSEEIIENCVFEELSPDKLGISIHKGFEISMQDKEKLKSCIRMTFGNAVKMVNVSVPQQKIRPKLSLVEVEQKQEIPLDTPRFDNQEWVGMKEKIAKFFPENQYQYVLFTWLSKLNLVTVEKNKIIVSSSDFYIDEILQRFSTAIDIAVILMKKNLVLQYESNQQRPIEFSCKPSSRRK